MLLSKISIPGLFLSQVTEKLYIDKSKYDEYELLQEINDKKECTILNPSFEKEKLNDNLKHYSFIINDISISKLYLYFNNDNLYSSIIIDNLTIDLTKNNDIITNINDEKKLTELNINNFFSLSKYLHNLSIIIRNIKIRYIENNTNKVLYSLLINEINYQKNKNDNGENENGDKEKEKYLFCHNKIITIGGIILKEGYNEKDEIFFNNDDKCNKIDFYTNPQILMIIYNKININITHDYQNNKLLINNIDLDNLFIECILNIEQCKNLIKFNNQYLNKLIYTNNYKDKDNDDKKVINNIKNEFDLFGFKIYDIEININFNYCYFIFLNSEQSINKFWMCYQNYFSKYYTMSIDQKKNIDSKKSNEKNNILNLIQKHFCYFSKEYFLFYINQPKFSYKNNNKNNFYNFSLILPLFLIRLIQPNKIAEKINVIIIDNKYNNNNEYIDNEQSFNNLFLPYYKQVIQYGYYTHNISNISNLELGNKENIFNEIDLEVNSFVLYNIYNYYKILFNIGNDIKNKNIEENTNNIKNDYSYLLKGNRVNLNLIINKKWIDFIRDKKINNCFDSNFYSEKIIISFENISFNINSNYQKSLFHFYFNKIYFFFIMKNIIYPLLYIINSKNNSDSNRKINNSIILSILNNNTNNEKSNYKYTMNFDKIFSFINPILITYYIIQYLKIYIYSFDIFKESKNKVKTKKYFNDIDIEENLNIESISQIYEFQNNKFNYTFLKILQFIKNIDIYIEEINTIFFCHLTINNNKFDIKTIFENNENIFKLILSPIIILKLKEFSYKNNKIKLNNILLIIKTKNENFNRPNLVYKEIIGDIDINNENYEFIIYKSKTQINLLEGEIKIEGKKNNIKLELNIEDIVFCPVSNGFSEIVTIVEKYLNKYKKMNSYLFSCFPLTNEKMDLINYEKNIKNNNIYINNNKNNDFIFKIELKCNKLFLDLYSSNKNKIFNDKNIFQNIIEKNKMRLIIELGEIVIKYTYNQKINISLQKINSAFLKDLRISQLSCNLLLDEYSNINYSIINNSNENSTNSLYFLNIVENNNKSDIDNTNKKKVFNKDTTFTSILANIGFVPIIECEKGILINIKLSSNNRTFNNISINTNNEIIIKDINLKFCKDSLKDIIYFGKKMNNDIQTLLNLKSSFKDDVEKIIIEKDAQSINNLLYNIDLESVSSTEIHSVKTTKKEYKNNNMYNRLLNNNIDKESINSNNNNKNDNIFINNNIIFEEKNQNRNKYYKKNNFKMNLFLNNINIYLYDGEDFNFQGNQTLVVFYYSTLTAENRSNQDNIIKTNDRNINNNILITLKDLQCKYSHNTNEIEMSLFLKSFIIEDNLESSIYKKLLSHFDFQNDKNIFFNSKIKITKEVNKNGINNLNAAFDLTSMAIYLDKITLDFIINYFNVLKYIIKKENDEDNEEDIYSNDSNKKVNNRIIQNNDDIMNINNDENSNNSNIDLLGEEISSLNQFQNDDGSLKVFLNPDKLYVNTLIINPFFISFNYNPRKNNSSEEEETETVIKTSEYNLKFIKYLEYLKNISLNELILNFKKYDNHDDNKKINIKNILKELFDYYYNDISDYKSYNNYVKALPVVNKFCSIFDGFFNIWNKTIDHEKNNISLEEGFVLGTKDLVVNTTCTLLSMGESIGGFLGKMLNLDENEGKNNNEGIIKFIKKRINENLSKKEEYFYK